MELPPLHHAKSRDGVRVAYFSVGNGSPIVFAANIFGHVEHYAIAAHHVRGVTQGLVERGWGVVRHDVRGMGSSDREVEESSRHRTQTTSKPSPRRSPRTRIS
jgi:alpha-beta hydrolase superfamily lysophospholipase